MRAWVAVAAVLAWMGTSNVAHADDEGASPRANVAPWVLVGAGSTAGVVGTVLEVFALSTARPEGPVGVPP